MKTIECRRHTPGIGQVISKERIKWNPRSVKPLLSRIFGELSLRNRFGNVARGLGFDPKLEETKQQNDLLLGLGFNETYIDRLNTIMHPKWYAASFTRDFRNPTQWSHYGDNHRGICMIFESDVINSLKKDVLSRLKTRGWSQQALDDIWMRELDVGYKEKVGFVDFFQSLGHLRSSGIKKAWFEDEHGNRSTCAPDHSTDAEEQSWFGNYMEEFFGHISTKKLDWQQESETRLVLTTLNDEPPMKRDRILEYRFEHLKGIIFGMRTPAADIRRVKEIIERKMSANNISAFQFSQAYYCHFSDRIKLARLDG